VAGLRLSRVALRQAAPSAAPGVAAATAAGLPTAASSSRSEWRPRVAARGEAEQQEDQRCGTRHGRLLVCEDTTHARRLVSRPGYFVTRMIFVVLLGTPPGPTVAQVPSSTVS